jgi:hypothetical protein
MSFMSWTLPLVVAAFLAACSTQTGSSAQAVSGEPMQRNVPGSGHGAGTLGYSSGATVPGSSIGTGSSVAPPAAASASRCDFLAGADKTLCERDGGNATSGSGSTDRVGPGSTGMGR